MSSLATGVYTPVTEKRVTVWRKPDRDGDGDVVYITDHAPDGQVTGTNIARDREGNEIRRYSPPDGFKNIPSHDFADNYVRVDERGRTVRNPAGLAVVIKEGQTLVEEPDGSFYYLHDDLSHYVFNQAHTRVSTEPAAVEPVESGSGE